MSHTFLVPRSMRKSKAGTSANAGPLTSLGESFADEQFLDGTIGFVDRLVRECRRASIGIGDGDAAETAAADHVGPLFRRDVRVRQRVVGVGVTVWPAIRPSTRRCRPPDRSRPARASRQMAPDFKLELLEGGSEQQFSAPAGAAPCAGARACWDCSSCARVSARPASSRPDTRRLSFPDRGSFPCAACTVT